MCFTFSKAIPIFRWRDPIDVLLRQAKALHGFIDQEFNSVFRDLMSIDMGGWPVFMMMCDQMPGLDQRENTS